jgi:hypothetical protein
MAEVGGPYTHHFEDLAMLHAWVGRGAEAESVVAEGAQAIAARGRPVPGLVFESADGWRTRLLRLIRDRAELVRLAEEQVVQLGAAAMPVAELVW